MQTNGAQWLIYTHECVQNVYSQENTPAGNMHLLAHTQMCACACGRRHTHTNRWSSWYALSSGQKQRQSATYSHIHTHPMTVFICSSTPSCLHSWSLSHTLKRNHRRFVSIYPRSLSSSHTLPPSHYSLSLPRASVVTFSLNSLRTAFTDLSLSRHCWDLTMRERALRREREKRRMYEKEKRHSEFVKR